MPRCPLIRALILLPLVSHLRAACPSAPVVRTYGVEDQFRPPVKKPFISPALRNSPRVANFPGAMRGFDDPGEDRIFAASFELPQRKLCSLAVEIGLRRRPLLPNNDGLFFGFAPFEGRDSVYFRRIWAGDALSVTAKVHRFEVPVSEINGRVFRGQGLQYLDLLLPDDTDVDFVKLKMQFY